jgi:TetR/AcrR family transcriptional regulator, tetracycline repressor protein
MSARRANQPQLTREQIVAAALALIDEHGLEGHSMRQLGTALGVDPTSIYHYVPSKSDLYDLLVDAVVEEFDFEALDATLTVRQRLIDVAHEMRRALLVHPKLMPLISTRSMRTPAQLRGVEVLLAILADAGFDDSEAVTAVDLLGAQVFGLVNSWAAHITDAEYHRDERPLRLSPEEFPHSIRVFADDTNYRGFETEFDLGVRALVDGLFSLHERGELGASRA